MRLVDLASVAIAALLAISPATAGSVRLATWNINNLNDKSGVPLRDDAPIRDSDYELLREYRDRLDADVIALQEMGNPAAAGRISRERIEPKAEDTRNS